MMLKERKINDPIFGLIHLSKTESLIIDTPLFQRLRYIKQLALTDFVYPTATHTRFSHSLGVFFITKKIVSALLDENPDLFTKEEIRDLRMASLLHDIGHFPFSHSLEFKKKDYTAKDLEDFPFYFKLSHERFGSFIIQNSYLSEILEKNGYDIELICNLIEGKLTHLILNKIINWELDADRLDYILRDSFFTGVGFGHVNYDYLINSFRSYGKNLIVIDSKAIRDIEHFIVARFSLYDRVYTHKTISFFNYFLRKAAFTLVKNYHYPLISEKDQILEALKDSKSSKELIELSDFVILNRFKEIYHKLKITNSLENRNYLRTLEIILFREKHFKIKKNPIFSNKLKGYLEFIRKQIESLISDLRKKYPNSIYLDTPKNRFTGYLPPNIPSSGISKTDYDKYKSEEEQTIWIQHKNEEPEIFYRSQQTFLEQLHEFGITKFLIYIDNQKKQLREDFKKLEPQIKKILNAKSFE